MSNSNWLEKILPAVRRPQESRRNNIPEGLWRKCPRCEGVVYRPELDRNMDVCPKCDHHLRIDARRRLKLFLDEGAQTEIGAELAPVTGSSSRTPRSIKTVWWLRRKPLRKKTLWWC